MSTVRELHEQAMEYAYLAMVARDRGKDHEAVDHARAAFDFELQAAQLVPDGTQAEPTRSILYRSAASLAYQSKDYHEAIRMIGMGLSGNPPPKILADLLSLLDQVKFESYISSLENNLQNDGLLLTLRGDAVGSGLILYTEFKNRFESAIGLINKTIQRLTHREYTRGQDRASYQLFKKAIEIPVAQNSFAMTIRLIAPDETENQLNLFADAQQVIEEVLLGIDLINNNQEANLQKHINNDKYYAHFVNTVREIAPDGRKVNHVGFVSTRRGASLTKNKSEIASVVSLKDLEGESTGTYTDMTVTGQLRYADDLTSGKGAFGLEREDGSVTMIKPSEGFDEIIERLWKSRVEVMGKYDGEFLYPANIIPLEE